MNQAVANRLLRMDRTIEAMDGKLDEVLALLRPIATPVPVIRSGGEIPVDAQAEVAERVLGALDPDADLKAFGVDEKVTAVLAEFGHERGDGRLVDAVRAALHAERRARDAANMEAGKARAAERAERECREAAEGALDRALADLSRHAQAHGPMTATYGEAHVPWPKWWRRRR